MQTLVRSATNRLVRLLPFSWTTIFIHQNHVTMDKTAAANVKHWLYQISRFPINIATKIRKNGPTNSVDINRIFLIVMSRLNIFPCSFELQGKRMTTNKSRLRRIMWKIELLMSLAYATFINLTLIFTVSHGLENVDKLGLGTHLTRAMFSTIFSYWAYQIFEVHFLDQAMIYEFAQLNPGNFLTFVTMNTLRFT